MDLFGCLDFGCLDFGFFSFHYFQTKCAGCNLCQKLSPTQSFLHQIWQELAGFVGVQRIIIEKDITVESMEMILKIRLTSQGVATVITIE